MATNLFSSFISSPSGPAVRLIAVTPADANLTLVCRMLFVGNGGSVVVRDLQGTVVTHENVTSGSYIGPFSIDRVTAATTATGIVGYV